jgi:hypothetical protein
LPEIDFQPEKRTVEDLFVGADYYVIPRFQRPYSWNSDNLDDFWRDVVYDNAIGYFIGPMVSWREPGSPIQRLVDGQQRITTIAIMFAVLRDQFRILGEETLADGVHRYLEKPDRNNERRFTLRSDSDSVYLAQAVFTEDPDQSLTPTSEEDSAISKALAGIRELVQEEVAKRRNPKNWLLEFRDRLLGLQVIWIENSSEDDAYVIFETLNSRGMDLEVVDLLKNLLLNRLRSSGNTAADNARTNWDKMRNDLEASDTGERINPNRFILHWWLSQEEYVAERKLFPAIRKKVKSKATAQTRLDSLVRDSPLYRAVLEPSSRGWPMEEAAAKRALEALSIFGVVQPAPLLLSLVRARADDTKLKAAQFNKTLQVVERFHFQHTVVSQLRSSGGVSEMYAKAARELNAAGADQQKRAEALDDIRTKLTGRTPDREQFILAFEERFYFASDYTRESKLVRYVLQSFLVDAQPTTGTVNLTIEHILPQSAMKQVKDPRTVGGIGNLMLVSEAINTRLDDKDFVAKKKILANEGSTYDIGGVLDQSQWGAQTVEDRAHLLAERAYDKVWKLPM